MVEPDITINGRVLTPAQAATILAAYEIGKKEPR